MPRKPRLLTDAGIYHVVTRGNNRQALFFKKSDYQFFLSLLGGVKEIHRFDLYHYCLMTNHVHLIIRFYDQESLQKVMQRVNLTFAKYYRRTYQYVGHVFQDRFKSFPIESDSYLLECGRYVERNPLNAGLVKDLKDYPWSSYHYYGCGREDIFLSENPLYRDLGEDALARQERYKTYLLTARPYEKLIDEALLRM